MAISETVFNFMTAMCMFIVYNGLLSILFKENGLNANFGSKYLLTNCILASESDRDLFSS